MKEIKFKSLAISVVCLFAVMALCFLFFYMKDKQGNVIKLSPQEEEMLQEMIDKMYEERLNESNSNQIQE